MRLVVEPIAMKASSQLCLAVGCRTDHHEGLIHTNVRHDQCQKRHHHKPSRAQPLEEACDSWAEDQIVNATLPPTGVCQCLAPGQFFTHGICELGLSNPEVGAWMKDVQGNQRHDEARGRDTDMVPALDSEVDPGRNGAQNQQKRPVLHQVGRHGSTISTNPIADILSIQLVPQVVLDALDDGVQQQRGCDVEELRGSPDVVHRQRNDLVRLHAGSQGVAHRRGNDHTPAQDLNAQHEAEHAHG
mmetsp:Transcript_16278/g.28426  ORF Transcript_16278/g.28426 Transcript_16278/m.28426 type:complete len:244 (+) Transcript_16278:268-999(+)